MQHDSARLREDIAEQSQDDSSLEYLRRLRAARRVVLLLLGLAAASAYLTRHCLAVANTTMQAELGINNEQFGYLYSAFSLGYLVFQVPGGWLGQRLGTRITMPLLSVLWSVVTVATALMTSLSALVTVRFAFGCAQGGLIPNQAKVINDWFPQENRGTVSSVIVMAMSVGSVASLWLTSWLMNYADWRTVFHGYSLVGVVWAIMFYSYFRATPEERLGYGDPLNSSEPSIGQPKEITRHNGIATRELVASPGLWGLVIQSLFKAAGFNLFVTYFPAFLEYAYKTPAEETGNMTTWSLAALIIGSFIGGRLIDTLQRRTGNKRISRSVVAGLSMFLTGTLMFVAAFASTDFQSAAIMATAALVSGAALPCTWAAAIDVGGRNSAIVMGYINIGACLAGVVITPAVGRLIDWIKETDGDWRLVIFVHAVFHFLAAACWLIIDPRREYKDH